jgi:hypothetical protein
MTFMLRRFSGASAGLALPLPRKKVRDIVTAFV